MWKHSLLQKVQSLAGEAWRQEIYTYYINAVPALSTAIFLRFHASHSLPQMLANSRQYSISLYSFSFCFR